MPTQKADWHAEIFEKQASLAKRYGIHAFCFYYYNFGDVELQEILKKYVDLSREQNHKSKGYIPPKKVSEQHEIISLIKYLILNNFDVSDAGYSHGLNIFDLSKGKTRIPYKN